MIIRNSNNPFINTTNSSSLLLYTSLFRSTRSHFPNPRSKLKHRYSSNTLQIHATPVLYHQIYELGFQFLHASSNQGCSEVTQVSMAILLQIPEKLLLEALVSYLSFHLKLRIEDGNEETADIIVYDYFVHNRKTELSYSAYMPCLDVGKPKRPNYLPLELCSLVSLQHYTKALSSMQRASLVEKSRQKPQERIRTVTDAVRNYRYDDDPMLKEYGISIEKQLTSVEGRVLNAPTVVGSRSWPLISRYRASVRTQSPKVEMIDTLFKLLQNGEDDSIIRELLVDFYQSSRGRKSE